MNTKTKGKIMEDWFADKLQEYGIDPRARRDGGSGAGNREKADIITSAMIGERNLGVECKNQKVLKIQEWWKQADMLQKVSREPVLAFKFHNEGIQATKVIIYAETFFELLAMQDNEKELAIPDDLKWKMKRLKDAAHEVFKSL